MYYNFASLFNIYSLFILIILLSSTYTNNFDILLGLLNWFDQTQLLQLLYLPLLLISFTLTNNINLLFLM